MLSLAEKHGEQHLVPIATLSYSGQGVGKDPLIDLHGIKIYLNKDYKEPVKFYEEKKHFDRKFPGVMVEPETKVDESFLKFGRDGHKMKKTDIVDMREMLDRVGEGKEERKASEGKGSHFARILEKAKQKEAEMGKDIGKSIQLNEGYVFPLPLVKRTLPGEKAFRQVYHLAARSDAGKSTWSAKLMRLWKHERKKLGLKEDIYIFSRVEADNAYSSLGAVNVIIDEELIQYPIDPKTELQDCLVVFDDIDKILDKKLREYMCDLRNGILQTGAHTGTYVINTCHHMRDWANTRDAMNEAHMVTVFPVADKLKIKEFMIEKLGVTRQKAEYIVNLPTRWLTFNVLIPSYVVYEHGVIIL
jgi:hypothetical protein